MTRPSTRRPGSTCPVRWPHTPTQNTRLLPAREQMSCSIVLRLRRFWRQCCILPEDGVFPPRCPLGLWAQEMLFCFLLGFSLALNEIRKTKGIVSASSVGPVLDILGGFTVACVSRSQVNLTYLECERHFVSYFGPTCFF